MFMSYRNIFTVLVSIIMAVGCDDPAATVDETEPYIIPVGDTVITAGPESARLFLQYSLKESDDYSPLFAECGEEWISDWDYSENGTVGFTVSANESGNVREAVVGLHYADNPAVVYRVVQSAASGNPDDPEDPDDPEQPDDPDDPDKPDPDEPFSITFNVSEVQARSAVVEAIPSRDDVMFYYSADKAGLSDGELKGYLESLAAVYVAMGAAPDIRSAIMTYFAGTGRSKTLCEDLYPDTDYVPYAFVFDSEGNYEGASIKGDIFHTPEAVVADAAISIVFDEYFNGDEVCQYYPAYADAAGSALLPVSVQLTGDAETYYYWAFGGDLTDPVESPDDLVINNLIYRGVSVPKTVLYLDFDTEYTILAVAQNSDEEYGEVFRARVVLERGGESPVQYFGQYL